MMITEKKSIRFSNLGRRTLEEEPVITRLMTEALAKPNLLSLAAGFTDNVILPDSLIAKAVVELNREESTNQHLQYGKNAGADNLRTATAEWLKNYPGEEESAITADDILITNGSQQALYISAQVFCEPGDIVLVESPSYFVFLELLQGLGLRPVSMPSREDGSVDFEGLEVLFEELRKSGDFHRIRLLYYMGVYANPSTNCWQEEDKIRLGKLLHELPISIPVIEDMAYRDLWFDQLHPARSVFSLDSWKELPVMYTGTFTKPFATGLKTGFAVTKDQQWREALARVKGHQDFGSAHFNQAILNHVLRSGDYVSHLDKIRPHYRKKMHLLVDVLENEGLLELGWKVKRPDGGLLLWAEGPEGLDTSLESDFHRKALEAEVLYVPGDLCFAEGNPKNTVRLSFGALPEGLLEEAAKRFVKAAREV